MHKREHAAAMQDSMLTAAPESPKRMRMAKLLKVLQFKATSLGLGLNLEGHLLTVNFKALSKNSQLQYGTLVLYQAVGRSIPAY